MSATVSMPENPELSATSRAIARAQYMDDAFPFIQPPGQLWERVAETRSNAPAPLTARQDAGIVLAYAARDIREHGRTETTTVRGVSISGIIRAGERVR